MWIWDASKASTKPYRIHKATDRPEVFYQPEFCQVYFQSLLGSSSAVLKKVSTLLFLSGRDELKVKYNFKGELYVW